MISFFLDKPISKGHTKFFPLSFKYVHVKMVYQVQYMYIYISQPLIFTGIGFGMLALVAISGIYYNVIVAWTLYYFGNSFYSTIPWSHCDNEWNTELCYTRGIGGANNSITTSFSNNSISTYLIDSTFEAANVTVVISNNRNVQTSAEEFWE